MRDGSPTRVRGRGYTHHTPTQGTETRFRHRAEGLDEGATHTTPRLRGLKHLLRLYYEEQQ